MLDNGAVDADKRHDISNNGQCKQRQELPHIDRQGELFFDQDKYEPCHLRSADLLERVGVIGEFRIDDRIDIGQCVGRRVVVGNDKIDTARFAHLCGSEGIDTVVDRKDQIGIDPFQYGRGDPVTVSETVGNDDIQGVTQLSEKEGRQCRCGHAVDIVVADQSDTLSVADRIGNTLSRFGCIEQKGRVRNIGKLGKTVRETLVKFPFKRLQIESGNLRRALHFPMKL